MDTIETASRIQQITQQLDRLIAEMMTLRGQVVALTAETSTNPTSVRQAGYFGMWADREDMAGQSSRAWLEELRNQQWRYS
ncbi:MAG: hypothetical protein D6768_09925 [Chloroflexi bacterium]|nr:MAG: hypothetical protein D6768_09925 [Chloroflexota bacterium]